MASAWKSCSIQIMKKQKQGNSLWLIWRKLFPWLGGLCPYQKLRQSNKPFLRYSKLSENFDVYQHSKNQPHHSLLSLDIAKTLHNCYSEYFARPHSSNMTASTYRKLYVYLFFFLGILQKFCKDWKICNLVILGMTGHAYHACLPCMGL